MAVACGNCFTLVATDNGDMYSFGTNLCGQLGNNSQDDVYEPRLVSREGSFAAEEVAMLAASCAQCAATTKQGSLFTWGSGQGRGQIREPTGPIRLGKENFGNSDVVMVDCGFHSMIVLTASGQVWTCGHTDRMEPPQVCIEKFCLLPPERFKNRKIVMVASGARHKMALDEDGTLWTWGDNLYGELCHETSSNLDDMAEDDLVGMVFGDPNAIGGTRYPVAIKRTVFGDQKVVHMDGGTFYTMVVTEDGSLWACGDGHVGNLGIGRADEICTPERVGGSEVFGGQGVRMTSCGTSHTLILGKDNRMWACGRGSNSELGMGDGWNIGATDFACLVPTLIPDTANFTNGNVMTVSAGQRHSVAVMCDGIVYTWGMGTCIARGLPRPAGLGRAYDDDVPTPLLLHPSLFHGSRVGHWHKWFNTHQDHALAAAMATHRRLGANTQFGSLPSDIFHRIVDEEMRFEPEYGEGLLSLLGLHNRRA